MVILVVIIAIAAAANGKKTPTSAAAPAGATATTPPSGAPTTAAPNVVGRSLAQAEAATGSGITVAPTDLLRGRMVIDPANWKVCTQDPAAGAPLAGHLAVGVVKYGETCVSPSASASSASSATVTFSVSGSAPNGVDITYGSDGSNRQGGTLPFTATVPLDNSGSTLYYAITAQLQGGGDIDCSVSVGGHVLKSSSASGGYNICSAQIGQDPISGQWTGE